MTYRKTCHLKVLMIFFANKLCIRHRAHSYKVFCIWAGQKNIVVSCDFPGFFSVGRLDNLSNYFFGRGFNVYISRSDCESFVSFTYVAMEMIFFRVNTFDVCWYNEFYGILHSIVPSFTGKLTAIHKKTSKARDLQQIGQCNPGENGVCNQEKSSLWPA